MAHYNPERRSWRGRSHRRGGERVRHLRYRIADERLDRSNIAGHQRQGSRLLKLQ